MGRGSESFQKRQREKNKRERAAVKQARRHGKLEDESFEADEAPSNGRSEAELYEDFRLLSEKFQSGGVDEETYEQRRAEIFEELGLEVH